MAPCRIQMAPGGQPRKVWLAPTARLPCSTLPIGQRKTWRTQSAMATLVITKYVPKLVAMAMSLSTARPHLTHNSLCTCESKTKQHLDRFSRFCTDDHRLSLYFRMGRPLPPKNCPFPWGDLDRHLTHGLLGPPESSTKTGSRSVQPFLQGSLA